MSNTKEAAEKIEQNIKLSNKLVETMAEHVARLELDGTEDLSALRANIKQMKKIIAKNEKTAMYIRNGLK